MIECIAESRYAPALRRTDVRPPERRYAQSAAANDSIEDMIKRWHHDVGSRSSPSEILTLPISRRLRECGKLAIPAIIRDLYREPSLLVLLAKEITGVDPVPGEIRGNIRKMSEVWVSWYLRQPL
jgi:hypothetical protein